MYPPNDRNGQYISLPNDPENTQIQHEHYTKPSRFRRLTKTRWFRPAVIAFIVLVIIALFSRSGKKGEPESSVESDFKWENESFMFEGHKKPGYLDAPLEKPVVIRLSIISRVDEYDRRQTLRETMLAGVKPKEVNLDYRFFVGKAKDEDKWKEALPRIQEENRVYNDVMVLDTTDDIGERLSEKRFAAIKWVRLLEYLLCLLFPNFEQAGSVPHDQYDYAMTLDSDTFCRFHVFAQKLRFIYTDIKPREQPVLLGRMSPHRVYYLNTVADGHQDSAEEDVHLDGPWYSYPSGIGYVLSSNLTATILNVQPSVAHHIHYPSDDVMIGSWIAGLKNFPDPEAKFETTKEPIGPAYPQPYYPDKIDTRMVDEVIGWHDFKGRGGHDSSIGWETVCIHRMKPDEMKEFRKMKEVRDEWDN